MQINRKQQLIPCLPTNHYTKIIIPRKSAICKENLFVQQRRYTVYLQKGAFEKKLP